MILEAVLQIIVDTQIKKGLQALRLSSKIELDFHDFTKDRMRGFVTKN